MSQMTFNSEKSDIPSELFEALAKVSFDFECSSSTLSPEPFHPASHVTLHRVI